MMRTSRDGKLETLQIKKLSEKGKSLMSEIRNPDNRFVYSIDAKTKTVERLEKGWITRVKFKGDGTVKVTHYKKPHK
jgi:hypothetical protein